MKAKTSTEVLQAAKWILENVGWFQGNWSYSDPQSGEEVAFCALGAINKVEDGGQNKALAKTRLMEALPKKAKREYANRSWRDIATFNDDKKTTKRMVLALFDRAIKKG